MWLKLHETFVKSLCEIIKFDIGLKLKVDTSLKYDEEESWKAKTRTKKKIEQNEAEKNEAVWILLQVK